MFSRQSYLVFALGITLALSQPLAAQFDPEGAQAVSYFPHLADGGGPEQKWVTTLIFVNPHSSQQVNANVALFDDAGDPLRINFGSGSASSFNLNIPPQGSVVLRSTAASQSILTGWAIVQSTLPLQGVVQFSYSINGVPQQGVSAQSTSPSFRFRSPATSSTGIALANIYIDSPIRINVSAINPNGSPAGSTTVTVPALGHQSFTLGQVFPSLPGGFRGTVVLEPATPNTNIVAWTLSSDGGVLSSYPPSGLGWPVAQHERMLKVWRKVLNAATQFNPAALINPPNLAVDYSTAQISAFANSSLNEVRIFMNLAELMSDSDSELAFALGHELGHIVQARIGALVLVPSNAEMDADQYGVAFAIGAGFDPYGAAGTLAKLAMASGTAGLLDQNFDQLASVAKVDPHTSFNERLAAIFQRLQAACAQPNLRDACAQYKSLIHPHLPPAAPLVVKTPIQ